MISLHERNSLYVKIFVKKALNYILYYATIMNMEGGAKRRIMQQVLWKAVQREISPLKIRTKIVIPTKFFVIFRDWKSRNLANLGVQRRNLPFFYREEIP